MKKSAIRSSGTPLVSGRRTMTNRKLATQHVAKIRNVAPMPMASRISGKTNETTKFAAHSENTEMPVHAALYCGGKISELSTK